MNKKGFSLIELIIVVFIIGVLVGVGSFSYNKMQIRAKSIEAKNHADNISRIISNMYKTGIYGNNKQYEFKGAYPSVATMKRKVNDGKTLAQSIKYTYDKESKINFIMAVGNYDPKRNPKKLIPGLDHLTDNKMVQKYLKNNSNIIIYQPLFSNSDNSPNKTKKICKSTVKMINENDCNDAENAFDLNCGYDDCREAVIYYVTYKNGKYQLAESNKLRAGIEEKNE